ncbi:MAG: multifunctional CCA addition/repair protein [Betaproteobacteria bacterium]
MKVYRVGGAVRDELLGLPVRDDDHVVVGATAEQMEHLGYRPVGKDFPVFLHPVTHEEYALARTERKTGRGYKGFTIHATPEVTLEEDLARRDLTINAIARDAAGALIDPFGGTKDIERRVLRHVSPAFVEDPVRILRVARFAARFGFAIAPETMALMRSMVRDGEADHLVAERVWQELAKGLMEAKPSRMFEVLRECGALERVFPEFERLLEGSAANAPGDLETGHLTLQVLDYGAAHGFVLEARYALLFRDTDRVASGDTSLGLVRQASERLRAPAECRDLALLAAGLVDRIHDAPTLDASAIVDVLQHADAFRRPERFALLLSICEADVRGRPGGAALAYPQAELMLAALAATRTVDAAAIAAHADKTAIAERIRAARVQAVYAALRERLP